METLNIVLWLIVLFLLIINIVMRIRVLKARKRLAEAQAKLYRINAAYEKLNKDLEDY